MVKTGHMCASSVRCHRIGRAITWLVLLALTGTLAEAGTLYRCVDRSGATAYVSSTAGYRSCKLIGNYPAARPAAAAPSKTTSTPPANEATTPGGASAANAAVEFRTAPGEGEPKAVPEAAGAAPKVTRGAVYKFQRNGVTHYTNRPPAGQRAQVLFTYIETCFACSAAPGLDFNSVGLNLEAYRSEIAAAVASHGVDEALVRAIIHAESAFNPNAVSKVGAQGLMQLMPATAARFGVTDAFTPAANIDGGTGYLAWLSERFDGDLKKIAAGYNAGEGAVDRYDGVPPYEETMLFVERVGILRERYRKELDARVAPATTAAAATTTAGGA